MALIENSILDANGARFDRSTGEVSLIAAPDERRRRYGLFDLASVIRFALIHAMEDSAKANNYMMKPDDDDGWYKYRGSIDTSLIASAVALAVLEKQAFDKGELVAAGEDQGLQLSP